MRQWWSDKPESVSWTSGSLSLAVTAALFTAAFLAMRTVRLSSFDLPPRERSQPTMVELPPPPRPEPVAPAVRQSTPTVAPNRTPTRNAPPTPPLAPTSPTRVEPTQPLPPRDSTPAGTGKVENRGTLTRMPPPPYVPLPSVNRATEASPLGRSGVTAEFRSLTDHERDSIGEVRGRALAAALLRPLTQQEKDSLATQTEPGRGMPNTRAGSGGRVVPLMNGGVSAAMVPLISIPVGGKSPAQRKREAAIDSVNREILARLEARSRLRRDSLRADSLRRDSLARIRP